MNKKILYLLLLMLFITGCGNSKNQKLNYLDNVNNAKTLEEYVKALRNENIQFHSNELGIKEDNIYYHYDTIKCDAIKDNNVLYFDYKGFVLENGDYYDYVTSEDKLYSNGEQCKKREDISNVVKVYYDKFYTKDNKICLMQYDMDNNYKFDCNKDEKNVDSYLIRKDDIKKVLQSIYAPSKNDTYYYYYFVIKTDGKLYKEEVTQKYFSDKYNISKEEVYLDSDKYGKIIDIDASYDYDNKELIIRKLLTENGLYILQENKTEECIKFEDIACKKELKKNDVLEKYKDSIKYFGTQKIVTKNNAIFSTDDFINKELIEFK